MNVFENELSLRNKVASFYSNNLSQYLSVPYLQNFSESAWAQYSLVIKDEEERDLLISHLNKNNIPTAIYYKKIFSELVLYQKNTNNLFPLSKKISKSIFSIPMHPYLTDSELNNIVNLINVFYK